MMTRRRPFDFDRLLRSWWGRGFVVLVLVIAVSLVEAAPHFEIAGLREEEFPEYTGWEVDRLAVFLERFGFWAAWGLVAWPIIALGSWILRFSGSWIIFLVIQIPLSGAIGWGSVLLDFELAQPRREQAIQAFREWREAQRANFRQFGPERPPDERSRGRPSGPSERPTEERGSGRSRRGGGRRGLEAPDLESRQWQTRLIQAALIYWAILGLGAGLNSYLEMRRKDRRAAELELRAERLRTQLARAKVDSLQSQLHPHFLFNALHSVGGLIRAGEEKRAVRIIAAIGELLRSTLDHGEQSQVPLGEEWRIAERYLEIEGIRLGERLKVSIKAAPDVGEVSIPALLLLPLVENAVVHGIAPRPEGGEVRVSARRDGADLLIEIRDDGPGFPAKVLNGEKGPDENGRRSIGLGNSRERLRAIYGDHQRFELSNPPGGGALVRILLPILEDETGVRDRDESD